MKRQYPNSALNLRSFCVFFLVLSFPCLVFSFSFFQEPSVIKINCGGPKLIYGSDVYLADRYSVSGKAFSNEDITDVANTTQDDLFITERTALNNLEDVSYSIPVTNGEYTVRLHFAEIFWGAPGGGPGEANRRVFDISLEGTVVQADYDIFAEVGAVFATFKEYTITVSDEAIDLNMVPSIDRPKISAIEIFGDGMVTGGCNPNDLAPTNVAKTEAQSAVVDGKMYVFGGFVGELAAIDITEIYDEQNNIWSLGTPVPVKLTHMGIVTTGTDIWLLGGFIGDHPGVATDQVYIYHTLTDSWSTGPAFPSPKASGAGVIRDNKIHYFGGLLPDRTTDTGEHLVLDLNDIASGWTTLAQLPMPRNHLSGAYVDGKIYAIGGHNGHDGTTPIELDLVHAYDPSNNQWTQVASLPLELSHFEPGTFVYNNEIYITGGRFGPTSYVSQIHKYNPVLDEWSVACELPEVMMAPAAKVINNKIIIANGAIDNDIANIIDNTWSSLLTMPNQYNVSVSVSLEGRTDFSGDYSINFYDTSNIITPKYSFMETATSQGDISIPEPIEEGDYKIQLLFDRYLTGVTNEFIEADGTIILGILRGGDANSDNLVSGLDLSLLASSFNSSSGQPEFNPLADFNNDGVVNGADLSLMASNYNDEGDSLEE